MTRGQAGWRAVLLAAALLAAPGCGGLPRVAYRLPDTALVPLSTAGIQDRRADYGRMFCSVLRHIGAEGGPWGECGEYIETAGPAEADLPTIPPDYRILVVPGYLGQCFSPGLQAFSDALAHLREEHGLAAEYLDVSALGSCEHNARMIARHLGERASGDRRRTIVVGYSKGGCDLMVMLAAHPEVREQVAAFITVAAPVGGSRLPDITSESMLGLIEELTLERCDRGDAGGTDSLRRPERQAFLREHASPLVPTYSLVAVSDETNTSRALMSFWKKLSAIALDQDGQVIASEGIVPGSRFLGVLKGDHWAVAVPFESWHHRNARRMIDHNHFPRVAVLEAALRVVLADMESPGAAPSGKR